MQTPQENANGYDDNSPINHVNKLKGNSFLIHGSGDDNVHVQNHANDGSLDSTNNNLILNLSRQ
jgi:hypothetical protein